MEDLKRLFRKGSFLLILLCLAVSAGSFFTGFKEDKGRKQPEESWEPAMEISGSAATGNTRAGDNGKEPQESLSSPYFLEEPDSLLGEAEEKELENSALSAALEVQEVYRYAAIEEDAPYTYTVRDFSREQRNRVVSMLGEAGYVSVTDGANMENHNSVRDFYSAYLKGQDSLVTIFDVNLDGLIGAYTFIHRKGNLQTFYVQIGWREGGVPEIISTAVSDIAEIKLTEKGYFIYAYTVQLYHSSLRQFWRAAPLSDRCRELTEKYLDGLSYVNYNVLVTDWDSNNVEDILMPCMFEDLYRMDTGEILRPENGEIGTLYISHIL